MAITLKLSELKRLVFGSRAIATLLAGLLIACAVVALLPIVVNGFLAGHSIDVVCDAAGQGVKVSGKRMGKWELKNYLCEDWNRFGFARDVRLVFESGSDLSWLTLFSEADVGLQQERKFLMAKKNHEVSFVLFDLNDQVGMPETAIVLRVNKHGGLHETCFVLNEIAFWRWRVWAAKTGMISDCVPCQKELNGRVKIRTLSIKDVLEKKDPFLIVRGIILVCELSMEGDQLLDLVEKFTDVTDSPVMVSANSYGFDVWVESGIHDGDE